MKQRLMRVALLSAFAAFNMHASLILVGSQQGQGGGFGNVANILTVHEVGQDDGTEAGCIAGGPGSTLVSGSCQTTGGTFTGGDEVNPTNMNFTGSLQWHWRRGHPDRLQCGRTRERSLNHLYKPDSHPVWPHGHSAVFDIRVVVQRSARVHAERCQRDHSHINPEWNRELRIHIRA